MHLHVKSNGKTENEVYFNSRLQYYKMWRSEYSCKALYKLSLYSMSAQFLQSPPFSASSCMRCTQSLIIFNNCAIIHIAFVHVKYELRNFPQTLFSWLACTLGMVHHGVLLLDAELTVHKTTTDAARSKTASEVKMTQQQHPEPNESNVEQNNTA